VQEKTCKKCGKTKLLSEFYKNKTTSDGYQSECKLCHSLQCADWRSAHPDKQSEYDSRRARKSHGTLEQKRASYGRHKREIRQRRIDEYTLFVWRGIRARAARNGHYFALTLEDIPELPECCPICGRELIIAGEDKKASPSIDRIAPIHGYVAENLTGWVCSSCNSRKHTRSVNLLLAGQAGEGWQRWAREYVEQHEPRTRKVRHRATV
jgi:hypothetical protein